MELRQLRYFVEIAGQGSFTRASRRWRSPSFYTDDADAKARVRSWAEQLFVRTARGVVLTELGRATLEPAQRTLDAAGLTLRSAQSRERRGEHPSRARA